MAFARAVRRPISLPSFPKLGVVCLLAFLGLCAPLWAQKYPTLRWQKFLGTNTNDSPSRMVRAPDSTIYLAGLTQDNTGCTNGLLMKVDYDGNMLWYKSMGGIGCDEIRDITTNNLADVFFTGVTGTNLTHPDNSIGTFRADLWVGKVTREGTLEWMKAFGGTQQDQGMGIALGDPKVASIMMTGSSWSRDFDCKANEPELNNQWMLLLNKYGQVSRSLFYGGRKNDWGQSITRSRDGGFITLGFTNSEDLDGAATRYNGDIWVMKTDPAGAQIWSKVIREPFEDMPQRIAENGYGTIAVVGSVFTEQGGKQFWLALLDKAGNVLTTKKWGGRGLDQITSIRSCSDGGFIMSGYSFYKTLETPYQKGRSDVWLIRVDPGGEIVWQQTFGGPEDEIGVDVVEMRPGSFFVLARKANTFDKARPEAKDDFWLLNVDEFNCSDLNPAFKTNMVEERQKVNTPIRFLNQSTEGNSWLWEFGDGTTSTDKSPSKIYKNPGVYVVKLTALYNQGCSASYTYPKPIVIVF
jgi:hypothetical protein